MKTRTHPAEQPHDSLRIPDELVKVEASPRERDSVRARSTCPLHVSVWADPPELSLPRPAWLEPSSQETSTELDSPAARSSSEDWRWERTRAEPRAQPPVKGGKWQAWVKKKIKKNFLKFFLSMNASSLVKISRNYSTLQLDCPSLELFSLQLILKKEKNLIFIIISSLCSHFAHFLTKHFAYTNSICTIKYLLIC